MEFVTTSEAAESQGVSVTTIRVWASRGRIAAVRGPDGTPIRHPVTGECLYALLDVAKAEHATRRRARR
ncbi:MAG TPA: hypothetical protein VF821_13650 [Lentzea sp.]